MTKADARVALIVIDLQIGMMDGSVRTASSGISAVTWWHLCLPDDGEPVGDF